MDVKAARELTRHRGIFHSSTPERKELNALDEALDEIERLRGLMKCQACGCQSFECDQCAESVDLSGEPGAK